MGLVLTQYGRFFFSGLDISASCVEWSLLSVWTPGLLLPIIAYFLTPLRCIDHHLADYSLSPITPSMSVTLTSYPLLSSPHPPHSFPHVPLLIPHHIFSVVACTRSACPPFFHSAGNPVEGALERRGLRVHSGGLYGGESRREVALPCMYRQHICPVTNAHDIMVLLIIYLPDSVRFLGPSKQLWYMPHAYATNNESAVR